MESVTHQGFEITHNPRQNPCAPYFVHGLRMHARNLEHAHELIDAHLARPATTGPRIVAADVGVVHGLSASQCRNRIEQASAQQRNGGRFAKRGLKLSNPVTGSVNIRFSYGDWDGGAA